ncbi:MAG: hypothetical protein ACKO0Z_04480 [Betaproteobacteria bacterium]
MFSFIPPAVQALIITSLAGGIYFFTYRLNENFDSWALYAQGINLIFLPAGIKHLAILLGGKWGAFGCFLGLFVLANEFWLGVPMEQIALYCLISTASTWGGIVLSLRVLGVTRDLSNLRFKHLPVIDLITIAIHGFITNGYFIVAGMKSENFIGNALAMMFGDFVGSFILLTTLWLGLSIWQKSPENTLD